MRSVDVVFPASICAMIPMLRVSSSLNARAILSFQVPLLRNSLLPAIMRECLVRFRHAVHVFLLLHRPAARIRRIDQFIRELVHHGLARALPRILQQPANRERLPAERIHFHRNLVVRAAHAPRLHFQQRLHVLNGLLENFQRIVVGLLRHLIHRAVKHPLRRRLLAFPHHRADELLHNVAGIDRIGRLWSPENKSFAWHCSLSLLQKSFHAQPLNQTVALLRRRGLGPLRAVLRSSLLAVLHARGVQRSAHDVIAHTRQILHAAAAHQHDRVLLQVMADTGNISRHFNRIRQANARHLAQRRVRFLRRLRVHANAHAPLLRTARQRGRLRLHPDRFTSHSYQLRKRRHSRPSIARVIFRGSRKARTQKMARERNPVLKGLLRIRRYNQQETPYALQEVEQLSWLQFGEAYSALRGWRPIPAALLSHSVLLCSGTEDISLPTQRLQTTWSRPTQGKSFPDKQGSIRRKADTVKSFATTLNNSLWKSATWHNSCYDAGVAWRATVLFPAALGTWLPSFHLYY